MRVQSREERLNELAQAEAKGAGAQMELDAAALELEDAWKVCVRAQKALQSLIQVDAPSSTDGHLLPGREIGEEIEEVLLQIDELSRRKQ